MKQSFIITVLICLALGESFTFINKKNQQKNKATTYCCSKVCTDEKAEKKTGNAQAEPYLPMVNMLRYNL